MTPHGHNPNTLFIRLMQYASVLIVLFSWLSGTACAQDTVDLPIHEEWDTYSATSARNVNGWLFCKSDINDQSIVQRSDLHAYLSTGSTVGSGTVVATPYLNQVPDTFSFRLYGSNLHGQTAQVEFGYIPDTPPLTSPSDICALFVPYDTVPLSVSNQWQRTTVDLHPYYALHGTAHRLAIRLLNSYNQELYLDEIGAWRATSNPCKHPLTMGTDFWVTFFYNYHETASYNPGSHDLFLLSNDGCNISITKGDTPIASRSLTSSNNHFSTVTVGDNSSLPVATPYNGGYHVTSTEDIWLYANNYIRGTQDIATVLPTTLLDTAYIVQDYPAWEFGAQVAFVATENNTVLSMTVPCAIQGTTITAGTTLTPTLMQGQAYMLISNGDHSSFSGMEVSSNGKPFAMFQGGRRVQVPTSGSGSDLLYDQATPPTLWGTEFVVAGIMGQNGNNYVRITSSEDNCSVTIDGIPTGIINRGQSLERPIPTTAAKTIVTSKPTCVILYLTSYATAGSSGDPSSIPIPPVKNGIRKSRFVSPNTTEISSNSHFLNIICDTAWGSQTTVDGAPLSSTDMLTTVGRYRVWRIRLIPGNAGSQQWLHHVENPQGAFVAYTYGLGNWESYSYSLGFGCETPPPEPDPDPEPPEVLHDTIRFSDTVCQGEAYSMPATFTVGGLTYNPPAEGHIEMRAGETATAGTVVRWASWEENDTLVHHLCLTLTVMPTAQSALLRSIIAGDTLLFADTAIALAGTYRFLYTAANGCDSVVTLVVSYEAVGLETSAEGLCPGEEVVLTATGTHTYLWSATPHDPSLDSLQGQNPISVRPEQTTTYSLLDATGNVIASITVGVEPPPTLCIESNRSFIDYDHPVLSLHDCSSDRHHTTWQYSDGPTLNGERARRHFHHPLPDSVSVTMTSCNRYNCCADTTVVFVTKIRSVWFPNIFFPDQQSNNRFGCHTSFETQDFELYIYNRQGLLVWHTDDINISWDGTHDGTHVPQGAYVYRWYLTDIYGERRDGIGTVTLIR